MERGPPTDQPAARGRLAWILLDWAASGFSTVLITLVVAYVERVVFPGGGWGVPAGVVWAWTLAVAMLASAALTPWAAAWADRRHAHQQALFSATLIGVGGLLLLAAVPPGARLAVVAAIVASDSPSDQRFSSQITRARRQEIPSHGIDASAAARMPVPAAESQLNRYTARSISRSSRVAGGTLATRPSRNGTGSSGATATRDKREGSPFPSSVAFTAGRPHAKTASDRNTHGIQAQAIRAVESRCADGTAVRLVQP